MRGGLGRSLLTAFLILAIVPLSAMSWFSTRRARHDIQDEVTAKLSAVAAMMDVQVQQWTDDHVATLAFLVDLPSVEWGVRYISGDGAGDEPYPETYSEHEARETLRYQLESVRTGAPAFRRLVLLDAAGNVLLAVGGGISPTIDELGALSRAQHEMLRFVALGSGTEAGLVVVEPIVDSEQELIGRLVGWISLADLIDGLQEASGLEGQGRVYLVNDDGVAFPQGVVASSTGIEGARIGQRMERLDVDYEGTPVIGAYRWLPRLGLVLVAEQPQETAFASTDTLTATVIGATLIVALITAIIAAVVTRQITRPVVQLTESALSIAKGDLTQQVPVRSRDEIGILAYVFNHMTAELKALYDDLEEKVQQRTTMLQKANYQIQRRALQMQASLEVGQAVTSILDPDQLLDQVVQVVKSRFVYSYAAVYTTNHDEETLQLRAAAGEPTYAANGDQISVDVPGPVGEALRKREAMVESHSVPIKVGPPRSQTYYEVALPLCLGERTLGVLDVQSGEEELDQDDVSVLKNVAHQITIALENARAYAVEREAVERLKELDRSKRRFLASMSHELRTPLTNIIGFSRLMLKGVEGPLTDQQEGDLEIIYQDSQHLLGLINDLLDISQIEAGLMELEFQDVDLAELIHSVMATASALVSDKEVTLRQDVEGDLPVVRADVARLRQVLVQLLANATKFTEAGTITVEAWRAEDEVRVSVSDTGVGIRPEDHERIFAQFEQGTIADDRRPEGAGLGLALSKEFVEMHGGEIWVESEPGQGSTFTFSLPLNSPN